MSLKLGSVCNTLNKIIELELNFGFLCIRLLFCGNGGRNVNLLTKIIAYHNCLSNEACLLLIISQSSKFYAVLYMPEASFQ